jgi:hypothetical protein
MARRARPGRISSFNWRAGLDARAIERVNWPLKEVLGRCYVLAGLSAVFTKPAEITVSAGGRTVTASLCSSGMGVFTAARFDFSPSGLARRSLDVCVFPRANGWTLCVAACRCWCANNSGNFRGASAG